MALNRPQGNSILKRSSLVIGGSGDGESQPTLPGTNNEQSSSQPILKKSKLSNRFDTLFNDETCTDSDAKGTTQKNSFLKPSKLDTSASSVFLSVQQNNNDASQLDNNSNPSEKFLSLTRTATIASNKSDCSGKNDQLQNAAATSSNDNEDKQSNGKETVSLSAQDEKVPENSGCSSDKNQEETGNEKPVFGQFSATSTFTFGQNLQHRVATSTDDAQQTSNGNETQESPEKSANGSSDTAVKTATDSAKPALLFGAQNGYSNGEASSKLNMPTQCKTGEENEKTVFQMNARLFQYDSEIKNWKERGQGVLKVNEESKDGEICREAVRIVMRTNATFQLILNIKIFDGQIIEKASEKAIKLSSLNDDQSGLTLYTIKGNPQNVDVLFNLLDARRNLLKAKGESGNTSVDISWLK